MFKINCANVVKIVVLLLILGTNVLAQNNEKLLPRFDYEVVSFPGTKNLTTQTHVYVWVRNTYLQFVKMDSVYSARYQINIGIEDQTEVSVLTEDKTYHISEKSYAVTIDPKSIRVHHFQFLLPPEKYQFRIRLLDLNSNRSRSQTRKKTVRTFERDQLAVSDVLFVTASDSGAIIAEKVIPSFQIPIQEKIYVYAEVVTPEKAETIKIESTLRQKNGQEGFNFSQDIIPLKDVTKVFLRINKESMVQGENQLYLKVTVDQQSKAVRKNLRFIAGMQAFEGLPFDDVIGPLLYVTDSDDWKKLRNAPDEHQDSLFQAFWKKRDPSPGSPENELFNEFYRRVDLANRNFGHSRKDGWKTDRGRVFIVFGPPDRVERSSPSMYTQRTYEIWYYDNLREKFVFYDEYGFGDFRLVSGNIRPAY